MSNFYLRSHPGVKKRVKSNKNSYFFSVSIFGQLILETSFAVEPWNSHACLLGYVLKIVNSVFWEFCLVYLKRVRRNLGSELSFSSIYINYTLLTICSRPMIFGIYVKQDIESGFPFFLKLILSLQWRGDVWMLLYTFLDSFPSS